MTLHWTRERHDRVGLVPPLLLLEEHPQLQEARVPGREPLDAECDLLRQLRVAVRRVGQRQAAELLDLAIARLSATNGESASIASAS